MTDLEFVEEIERRVTTLPNLFLKSTEFSRAQELAPHSWYWKSVHLGSYYIDPTNARILVRCLHERISRDVAEKLTGST